MTIDTSRKRNTVPAITSRAIVPQATASMIRTESGALLDVEDKGGGRVVQTVRCKDGYVSL